MGHTNSTANIALPQFIGTDKPTWLGDVNGAFSAIDSKVGTIDADIAATDAKADNAVADAASAVSTATSANTTAGNASTTATNALNIANNALTVANNADGHTNQLETKVGLLADLTTSDKTSIVNAINEVNSASATTVDITSQFTDLASHDNFKAILRGKCIQLIGSKLASTANSTKLYDIPAAYTIDESTSTNYTGVIYADNAIGKAGALRINTSGEVFIVNLEATAMTSISYSVIIPIQ